MSPESLEAGVFRPCLPPQLVLMSEVNTPVITYIRRETPISTHVSGERVSRYLNIAVKIDNCRSLRSIP